MQEEVESYLDKFNFPATVYVHFDRRRRRWSVTLYRRVLGVNHRLVRIFHTPDDIYSFVDKLCERGCILKTELPELPESKPTADDSDRHPKL